VADELPAGLWHGELPLNEGERVLYSTRANRTAGRRAIGGRLVVTNQRIAFVPNRVEQHISAESGLLEGSWVTDHDNVDDVRVSPRQIKVSTIFSGEWRTGVWVELRSGAGQRFLVPRATQAIAEIRDALSGPGDREPSS